VAWEVIGIIVGVADQNRTADEDFRQRESSHLRLCPKTIITGDLHGVPGKLRSGACQADDTWNSRRLEDRLQRMNLIIEDERLLSSYDIQRQRNQERSETLVAETP
jgi:hypothetical protein